MQSGPAVVTWRAPIGSSDVAGLRMLDNVVQCLSADGWILSALHRPTVSWALQIPIGSWAHTS